MRRAVLILVLFFGVAGSLGAQTQQGSWANLNRLKVGQGIEVIESSLKRHAGKFVTVTDELLTLSENASDVSVKRGDVVRVSMSGNAIYQSSITTSLSCWPETRVRPLCSVTSVSDAKRVVTSHAVGARLDGISVLRDLTVFFVLLIHVNMPVLIAEVPSHERSPRSVRVLSTARRGVKTLMKTSLIVMLLLCCGFDALEAAHAQQEDVSRIEAYCTPGKPSAVFDPTRPAEAIIARHDGARYEPTVALNVPRKGIRAYSERSAALSRQDWDRLVALVQQRGLLSFKPDEEPGGFSITVRPDSRSKAGHRTHSIEPRKSFPCWVEDWRDTPKVQPIRCSPFSLGVPH